MKHPWMDDEGDAVPQQEWWLIKIDEDDHWIIYYNTGMKWYFLRKKLGVVFTSSRRKRKTTVAGLLLSRRRADLCVVERELRSLDHDDARVAVFDIRDIELGVENMPSEELILKYNMFVTLNDL